MLRNLEQRFAKNNPSDKDNVKDEAVSATGTAEQSRLDGTAKIMEAVWVLQRAVTEEKQLNKRIRRDYDSLENRLLEIEANSCNQEILRTLVGLKDTTDQEFREITDGFKFQKSSVFREEESLTNIVSTLSAIGERVNVISEQMEQLVRENLLDVNDSGQKTDETEENNQRSLPKSCTDIIERKNGVYTVYPEFKPYGVDVYCNMEVEYGGWMVFQKRQDGSVNFYRDWNDYKNGFGNISSEFWLGNDNLNGFTKEHPTELRIDLVDRDGNRGYAKYDLFAVDSEENGYKLSIQGYSGNIRDAMSSKNDGVKFSTKDRDNDNYSGNCAVLLNGGWWYGKCTSANLNGGYTKSIGKGTYWYTWHFRETPVRFSQMMIRWKK